MQQKKEGEEKKLGGIGNGGSGGGHGDGEQERGKESETDRHRGDRHFSQPLPELHISSYLSSCYDRDNRNKTTRLLLYYWLYNGNVTKNNFCAAVQFVPISLLHQIYHEQRSYNRDDERHS